MLKSPTVREPSLPLCSALTRATAHAGSTAPFQHTKVCVCVCVCVCVIELDGECFYFALCVFGCVFAVGNFLFDHTKINGNNIRKTEIKSKQ